MATFSSHAGTYQNACNLIKKLQRNNIRANITVGGVAIEAEPNQVNLAQDICTSFNVSFKAGYTETQENMMMRSNDRYEHLERVTNDARSIIKEMKE